MTCHFVSADLKKLYLLTGINAVSSTISSCVLTASLPNYNAFFICIFNANYLEIFMLPPHPKSVHVFGHVCRIPYLCDWCFHLRVNENSNFVAYNTVEW